MVKSLVKSCVARMTHAMLRVAHVPRVHGRLEQRAMMQGASDLRHRYLAPPPKDDPRHLTWHENSVFSQNGEDGILQHIFAEIGTDSKRFIEFGVEDGTECNSAFLAIEMGWTGLLMDGSDDNARKGRIFYDAMIPHRPGAVVFKSAWITRENINGLIKESGFQGEIDLLSVDIDGNDYWVWQAIDVVQPRVVVAEYNATFGPERAVTVPYQPDFDRTRMSPTWFYHGASLAALEKLGRAKGYRLIGCESTGVNAFFVREDLMAGHFHAFSAREAYIPQRVRLMKGLSTAEQMSAIQQLRVEEV